jgi:proteasome alpha subunit
VPLPYYVSPEQMMKDKAEYARKGIARGRSIVTLEYRDGILLVAENPSSLLHKVSEIYDRIAFAGVGKYNEFENLRIAGIRHADVKGYSYSRGDVTAKALANAYSQALGNIFTQDIKPFEVEVLVAEVGDSNGSKSEIYHILYDGTIEDEHNYAAMGGQAAASSRTTTVTAWASTRPCSSACAPCRSPRTRRSASATWRSRCSTGPRNDASSDASRRRRSVNSWPRPSSPC